MKTNKTLLLAVPVMVLMWVIAACFYPVLPDSVPVHFNMQGEADDFMDKPWGALMIPLIATGTLILLMVLPALSPRGFRLEAAGRAYGIVVTVLLGGV